MSRFLTTLLGLIAAALGAMILGRTTRFVWQLQLALNEFSWVAGIVGLTAMIRGWRQRNLASLILGGYGFLASLWPIAWIPHTLIAMESEMQRGLGADYALKIPQTMWPRLARFHWSLLNTLGRRNYDPRATITHDIIYARPGVRSLKLDVYESQIRPARDDLYPAIITIHPGSWRNRDKGEWYAPHHRYLASQGYVVFDIQYRLAQEATWPAQIEDVLCAIQWVRDHAAQYQVNPACIALMGRSAGAHLALRTAYDARANVQAVVALYPPTDLRLWFAANDSMVAEFMGKSLTDAPEYYAEASPVELIRDDLPPTLLITGLMDANVSPVHSATLANRLMATNTPVVTLQIPWSRHGFDSVMPGLGAQVAQYNIDRFLAWSLYQT